MSFSLEQFKEKFPVPPECLNSGEAFEYFWTYDLTVEPEDFWPFIADSSRMNREVGYEEVHYEEKDGVLHGWSGEGRLRQEWIEYPFEWNYPVFIRRLRKYSVGLPDYNFIQGYIEPLEQGCRVYIHNVVYSNHPLARKFLPRYLAPFGERYGATFAKAVQAIKNNHSLDVVYPPVPIQIGEDGKRILEERLLKLRQSGFEANEVSAMKEYILRTDSNELFRIRPLALKAPVADPDRRISAFLHGVLCGLFTMNYEVICPHCRGSRESLASLAQVPVRSECHICEIEFNSGGKESIEITFRLHPAIAETYQQFYCAAEPSRKTHVRIQRILEPGEQSFPVNLTAGRYRFLLQRQQLPLAADFKKEETAIPGLNGKCELENPFNKRSLLMVEEPGESVVALRPSRLFGMQEFRDFFTGEQLSTDLQIDLGTQTITFVDIVGSTGFYEDQGDGPAFEAVKKHFEFFFDIVQKHKGAVIKTIGDGAMFCFPSSSQALRAGLEAMEQLRSRRDELGLSFRYTMHEGPCLAVNFNTGIDYFGSTVNLAAKLQNVTGANEIGLSEKLFRSDAIQGILTDRKPSVQSVILEYDKGARRQNAYVLS